MFFFVNETAGVLKLQFSNSAPCFRNNIAALYKAFGRIDLCTLLSQIVNVIHILKAHFLLGYFNVFQSYKYNRCIYTT